MPRKKAGSSPGLPPNPALDVLGRIVGATRDDAIEILDNEMKGRDKSKRGKAVHRALAAWPSQSRGDLPDLVAHVVDLVLHSFLSNLDSEYDLTLSAKVGSRRVDVREESSFGLPGELPGSDGWIQRFSEHPRGRFEKEFDED